jgi:hypothetical protein
MNKQYVHDRHLKIREYFGQSDAEPLIEWLNRTVTRENDAAEFGLARVQGVIDRILRLQNEARKLLSDGNWGRKPKKFDAEAAALNATLQNYEFFYGVHYSKSAPIEWALHSAEELTSGHTFTGETLAVLRVVELAKQGLLYRVRRCNCRRYFFARLPAQRFHSAACRIQFWEASPERKQRRREKAREYYHLHRSGKVR